MFSKHIPLSERQDLTFGNSSGSEKNPWVKNTRNIFKQRVQDTEVCMEGTVFIYWYSISPRSAKWLAGAKHQHKSEKYLS